jgi:hypothetical protein
MNRGLFGNVVVVYCNDNLLTRNLPERRLRCGKGHI